MNDRSRRLTASREEARRLTAQPLSEVAPSRRDFAQFVATQKDDVAVIARLTSGGAGWTTAQLVAHARACDDADVAALAVVGGGVSLADLAAVAAATTAPILRDDLLLHPSQLYFSRLHGADAAMFPTADVDGATLHELVAIASSLHMASVVEVSSEADVEAAIELPHALVGLRCTTPTGELDVQRTQALARRIPQQRTVICLPEVRSAAECAALRGLCDAVVIGDPLVGSDDFGATLRRLVGE